MDRPIAYAGPARTIAFAVAANCAVPGFGFFHYELDDSEQAKLYALFVRMGDTGRIYDDRKFKSLEDADLFEFKSFQIRMPCYHLPGGLWVITHGFRKKGDRIPPSEIERANRIRQEDTLRFLKPGGGKKC